MHLSLQSEATLDQETRDLYKELCSATKQGDLEKTESLVKSFGAPINFVDEWQCSPLYWACLCGHYEVVKFLLENGAQCDRNTFQGEIRNLLLSYKLTKAIDENQPYLQFLSGLLAKPDYKDLTFTIPLADQDGAAYREFSVHRFVLAARSEFFRLRLLTRWRGNTRISLQATLVDSVSFAAILGFLYTGHIGDLEPSALDNAVFVCKHLELWNAVERFRDIQEDTQNADRSHDSKEIARIRGDLGACLACLIDTAVKILPGSNDKSYIVSERFVHTAVPRDPLSTFADVAVRLDDVVFPCHKACLVRSEYFEAMLGGMFSEAEMDASSIQFEDGNCLTVPMLQVHGIDADLFPHILEYMYTDRCMVPAELAYELMLAADMLLLDRLKGIAAIVLTNQEEPVMDIYQLIRTAVDLNIDRLEQWCIKYFAEHFDDFIHKEEFKALILESAESIAGRQETDTIPFVDDLRYFLSKKYSVDEEDINEDGTMNEEYRDTWTELILQYRSKLTILDDVLVSLGLEA
ncbi:uncharacterized protein BYT42DRAFT_594820 [Radiomyces spectabilis]|uniref:uncharacterized protein n=1 Tax=Radiomyces spectabilis TaxID=64574 RepID=UPI00221E58BC|nr:uncharacterized protein BYT42DRAFT_594820 [Radiomyces spectabilis]KAI8372974.1 hypothetical protein BYT42DRAFT_594820 [Radiomyces spectabilis]